MPKRNRATIEPAPRTAAAPLVIRAPGASIEITTGPELRRKAVSWAYTVRNRIRWASDPRAVKQIQENVRRDLDSMGLGRQQLDKLGEARMIEVSIPFTREEDGWELRILPWEFLLVTGTGRKLTVSRHLDSGNRAAARAPMSAAIVASLPGKLVDSGYELESEIALMGANLPFDLKVWRDPTLQELAQKVAQYKPDVIHLAGVDLHEGREILGTPGKRDERFLDGFYLKGEDGSPAPAYSKQLAESLTASGAHRPVLISVNVYNSASRLAALAVAGGADAAIGFQDEMDNIASEEFFLNFYREWARSKWNLRESFQTALDQIRRKIGSGVVLWSGLPLLQAHPVSAKTRARGKVKARPLDPANDLVATVKPVESVNYSLLHNQQSLFERFTITNRHNTERIEGIRVYVELCVGDQNYPFRTRLDLGPGDMAILADQRIGGAPPSLSKEMEIRIPLTSTLFRSLREAVRSVVFVKISVGESDLIERTYPVRLLAIDEWLDTKALNAFMPSFVLSRDPAVARVVDAAQRYLMTLTDDPSAGFDGYQSVDLCSDSAFEPVDQQVWALWSALSYDFSISYINPPPSFEAASQRLRSPSDVIEGKRGTCIDLALLLAACLEYVGLYPVIFLLNNHAFPGYWRSEQSRERFVLVDAHPGEHTGRQSTSDYPWVQLNDAYGEVMELVRCGDLAPVETVWLTQHKGFWEARDAGMDNLRSAEQFESVIDIQRARDLKVTPLPVLRREV